LCEEDDVRAVGPLAKKAVDIARRPPCGVHAGIMPS
jgi:hypothetical protein